MLKTPQFDKALDEILNNLKPHKRICKECDINFDIFQEDISFYKKMQVPPPILCPDCREQRRLSFRNERSLYKRKCDLCQEEIISIYSQIPPSGWTKPFTIYCPNCWFSDKWNSLANGQDFDFSKSFFSQFKKLAENTPRMSLFQMRVINSKWSNNETNSKNCYLNVGGHYNEDCAYNTYAIKCKDCFDNYWIFTSNLCYENVFCRNCYQTFWSQQCFNCIDTILSYDCRNCQNIIGCGGLRNKQYYIFNKPRAKEEYFAFLKKYPLSSRQSFNFLRKEAHKTILKTPHQSVSATKFINVSGNYIEQSKNCQNCWNVEKAEDCKNLFICGELRDSYDDSSVGLETELTYEVMGSMKLYNVKFSFSIDGGYNIEYSNLLSNCHDCFGCISLRNKSFCIFNKQYSESDYYQFKEKIVARMKITNEYGEFFPMSLSTFGYNETVAQNYFPLSKTVALQYDANWNDYESLIKYEFSDYQIPDDIRNVSDDILEKILKCEISGKAYRIIPMELEFYRKMGLLIPRRAPLQRHKDKLALRTPRKLWHRKCQCAGKKSDNKVYENTIEHPHHKQEYCPVEFETSYAPERPEIVYCEQCYQGEVV